MLGLSNILRKKLSLIYQTFWLPAKNQTFLRVKPAILHRGSYIKYFLILSGATIRLFEEEEDKEKGLDDSLSQLLNSLSVGDLHPH